MFDIISCQFAMHYMFEEESWIRTFLKNISDFLMPGGHFIATLCDGNAIVRTLRNRGYKEGNETVWKVRMSLLYKIEFDLLHRHG